MFSTLGTLLIVSFSQFIFLALSVDRYILIKNPLHYQLIITESTTWCFILLALCLALSLTTIGLIIFEVSRS